MLLKLLLTSLLIFSFADAKTEPTLLQKGELKPFCKNCGMHLKKFYKTNHALKTKTKTIQFCSIHCLVEELENTKKDDIKEILAVDTPTQKFTDATKAFYVVGSSKKGTMTKNSKFAFAKKDDAQNFAKEFGGKVFTYIETLKIAQDDYQKDMMMVNKKRSKMAMMGEKIHSAMCDKKAISELKYEGIGDLKAQINKNHLCSGVKKKKLQAVAIFLASKNSHSHKAIKVPKGAKCPVCGMFVDKYPKWVAMIGDKYFDGVKDMMKFYFDPKRFSGKKDANSKVIVSDYYTLKPIDAKKAWFVIGSNIYGPMGSELIPFSSNDDAKAFFDEHKGQKIVKFEEITEDLVYKLDQ